MRQTKAAKNGMKWNGMKWNDMKDLPNFRLETLLAQIPSEASSTLERVRTTRHRTCT
jgi:ribonuclease I